MMIVFFSLNLSKACMCLCLLRSKHLGVFLFIIFCVSCLEFRVINWSNKKKKKVNNFRYDILTSHGKLKFFILNCDILLEKGL